MNIALDEIRSKAPEGATHYVIEECGLINYVKMKDNLVIAFINDVEFELNSETFKNAYNEPKPL